MGQDPIPKKIQEYNSENPLQIGEEYYKNAKEKGCDEKLVTYVLEKLISCQFGYSFKNNGTLI